MRFPRRIRLIASALIELLNRSRLDISVISVFLICSLSSSSRTHAAIGALAELLFVFLLFFVRVSWGITRRRTDLIK